jgi:hypothetical protein
LCLLAAACGASAPLTPSTPSPLPPETTQAEAALASFGATLYDALAHGRPDDVAFGSAALHALLDPDAEMRLLAVRANAPRSHKLADYDRAMWAHARFAEICVQQGRAEPAGGELGLRADGFVFERALVVGREPDGGALAGWVEGEFLHTDAGFGALSLERVEAPRRDHADLELAVCELRAHARDRKP